MRIVLYQLKYYNNLVERQIVLLFGDFNAQRAVHDSMGNLKD